MLAPDSQTSTASQAPTQTCTKCGITRPRDDFYARSRGAPDRKHRHCKLCIRANAALWQKNNRERHRATLQANYLKRSAGKDIRRRTEGSRHDGIRLWLVALKSNPCFDCGKTFPTECMDLDHVRGTKLFNIASVRGRSISDEDLLAEIQKCDLVCANCHRVRTNKRRNEVVGGRPVARMAPVLPVRINLLPLQLKA